MSCPCPSSSPTPSCVPYAGSFETKCTEVIAMYLGERRWRYGDISKFKVWYAYEEDFVISDYDAVNLVDAEILPANTSSSAENGWPNGTFLFDLTEKELLSTGSFESWLMFTYEFARSSAAGPVCSSNCGVETFGYKVLVALGYNPCDIAEFAFRAFESLTGSGGLVQVSHDIIGRENSVIRESDKQSDQSRAQKLIACYEWFKNIYDTYYGKTYLVKVSSQITPTKTTGHTPFKGICIKDSNGNYPNITVPYVIDGNGLAQGVYLSDEVSSEGGYLGRPTMGSNLQTILGLQLNDDLDIFKTEDGRIGTVIKIGELLDSGLAIYKKFGLEWVIDISKLSPENYTIQFDNATTNLYLKGQTDEKIYVLENDSQYVLCQLAERVPYRLNIADENTASWAFKTFCIYSQEAREALKKHFNQNQPNASSAPDTFGAAGNSTQWNLLAPQDVTMFPAGFAIPFKSNIFTYGPYYYDAGIEGGGTEVIREEVLAPWNFSVAATDNGSYNLANSYLNMDCVGRALARDATKGLQRLEKGRITVAGIPAFELGKSVDGAVQNGPTILTDISVEYGSNGFTTTYNFETYTPRFGKPGRYILDSWSESIRQVQATNRYLKEERLKVLSLSNTLKKNIASALISEGKYGSRGGPASWLKATPNKVLIAGYYLDYDNTYDDNNQNPGISDTGSMPEPEPNSYNQLGLLNCDPCNIPSPQPVPAPSSSPIPNKHRLYTFAETHQSYQEQYVQNTYHQLSVMTLDGLFLPVSLKGDTPSPSSSEAFVNKYRTPRFALRQDNDGSFVEWYNSTDITGYANSPGYPNPSKTRDEMPPFSLAGGEVAYALPINQQYLNPILSTRLLQDWSGDRQNGTEKGFVISSISFGYSSKQYQLTHTSVGEDNDELIRQEQDNFRFVALRGPLVIQGWGYDTSGKPIPNSNDSPKLAEAGKFRRKNLTNKFMADWIQNPRTWPVGPVDLRFDRERGVWTCPSPNKIVVARLKEPLSPGGKAEAELLNPKAGGIRFYENYNISGPNGENVKLSMKDTIIEVYDYLGVSHCACDVVYAYYDDNRYIVLESSRNYREETCPPCTSPTPSISPSPSASVTPSPSPSLSPSVSISPPPSVSLSVVPSPSASSCFCGLECLQTLPNYDPCKTQALIHKAGCLRWEDIVQCDPEANRLEQEQQQECQQQYE